jgi:glutamyl-tRNA reductase
MGDLMARHLQRSGVHSLMVTNRTFDRAVELAGRNHGSPILFEDFPRYLTLADLVIGCTGSPEILVDAATVDRVLRERKQKAMFFIDIGDRRNFDPAINEIDNVYLYNIDDLKSVAEENLQERSSEAEKAEEIVYEEVQISPAGSILSKPRRLRFAPKAGRYGSGTGKTLGGGLRDLSEKQREALEDMTIAMMNKILHAPMSQLKLNFKDEDEKTLYIAALKKLFDLER